MPTKLFVYPIFFFVSFAWGYFCATKDQESDGQTLGLLTILIVLSAFLGGFIFYKFQGVW